MRRTAGRFAVTIGEKVRWLFIRDEWSQFRRANLCLAIWQTNNVREESSVINIDNIDFRIISK